MLEMLTTPCRILTAGTTQNGFGTATDNWDYPTETVSLCRLQLSQGVEDVDGRDLPTATGKLFLPPDAVIDTHKRVRVADLVYEVVSVYPVHEPEGLHHYEVVVRGSGGVPGGES